MKTKMMSRQAVQVAASNKDADFHETDEVGNRCGEINQEALNWALKNAAPDAIERYNKLGKKLVIGDDLGPYNAGPLWIWYYMQYVDNADKTETVIQSPMMRTPTDYPIGAAAGFLKTKQLPAAIANGMNQPNTSAGKLNGATPQNTPSGCRVTRPLIPGAIWARVSPCSKDGALQAISMISITR